MEETVCLKCEVKTPRATFFETLGLLSFAYLLSVIAGRIGLSFSAPNITGNISVIAAIAIGLLAGTSSCISVAGGLLLASASRLTQAATIQFALGRVLSYAVFGAGIGFIGRLLVPSNGLTSALMLLAAFYMIYAGFDLLGFIPQGFRPRLPFRVRIPEVAKHPFLLGAATFFLPCGFTQSLQLYALTTGSPFISGMILGGFAFGTVPALFALGAVATRVRGSARIAFFHFSGVIVLLLGIMNVKNGVVLSGAAPLRLFHPALEHSVDPNVVIEDGEQVIRMSLGTNPAYSPSDHYTVKAGIPVKMEIAGKGEGCRSIFTIPKEHISVPLIEDVNTVSFIPQTQGTLVFSCSMGMYTGTIDVL